MKCNSVSLKLNKDVNPLLRTQGDGSSVLFRVFGAPSAQKAVPSVSPVSSLCRPMSSQSCANRLRLLHESLRQNNVLVDLAQFFFGVISGTIEFLQFI